MKRVGYMRRPTVEVDVAGVPLGGNRPIRVQSMTNTSTMDTEASVAQAARIAEAGGEYVRLTAQGVREADNIGVIRSQLRKRGIMTPLVADIHFNPKAAFAATSSADKVRINPGNFVDPGRTFTKIEFTDEEYQREIQKISETLVPFLNLCKANGTAIRIGVNHGSLSDRIMSRYGDTPEGMVESAMEFLRVCRDNDFHRVVISIKASNVRVMVTTVRLLARAMEQEDMAYPLHLGVTEAGDGEDGRVKSAVGIGTLLSEGLGDTIRVSLSEAPEAEIPVARMLVDHVADIAAAPALEYELIEGYDAIRPARATTLRVGNIGGDATPIVVGAESMAAYHPDNCPDYFADALPGNWEEIDVTDGLPENLDKTLSEDTVLLLTSRHPNFSGSILRAMHELGRRGINAPTVIKASYPSLDSVTATVHAAMDLGTVLMNGFGDGIWIDAPALDADDAARLSFGILQATRLRVSRTEYIACPGCGRTLFDLQNTLREVKAATSRLKGLKIGVMGCIVNGPGEMADADYGYVGAGIGKVSLYRGKECVEKNIPASEALPRLIALIKADGRWK